MDIFLFLALIMCLGLITLCGISYLMNTFDPPTKAHIIVAIFTCCFVMSITIVIITANIDPKINEDNLQYYKSSYIINPDGIKRQICITNNEIVDIKEILGYVIPDDSIVCRYYYHKLRWIINWGDAHDPQYKIIDILNLEYKEINEKYFLSRKGK